MTDLEKLIESNAKAVEVLTSDHAEMKRDRHRMYGLMSALTEKLGRLTSHQIRSYELIESLDNRQQQMFEIQKSISKTLEKLAEKIEQ